MGAPLRSLKFGRKPAVHTGRSLRAALAMARSLDALGTPPAASNDYVKAVNDATNGDWGMMGNDAVGDCTIADCAHQIMIHTANASQLVVPTTADVLAAYSAATGYDPANPATDQGADEVAICRFMFQQGLLGHKSNGYGPIDPTNTAHLKWAVQLFGACRIGFVVTQAAMDQFNAGQPWDATSNQTILGLHDVPIVRYDSAGFDCITWGRVQRMTPAFFAAYCDELHAEVYADWIRASGVAPSGFDLATLLADLSGLLDPQTNIQKILAIVEQCFIDVLGRAADVPGLNFYASQVPFSERAVRAALAWSAEFVAAVMNGDGSPNLPLIYRRILMREPDAGGLAWWQSQGLSGPAGVLRVVQCFTDSAEFRTLFPT